MTIQLFILQYVNIIYRTGESNEKRKRPTRYFTRSNTGEKKIPDALKAVLQHGLSLCLKPVKDKRYSISKHVYACVCVRGCARACVCMHGRV